MIPCLVQLNHLLEYGLYFAEKVVAGEDVALQSETSQEQAHDNYFHLVFIILGCYNGPFV
jgi:hypothetical protein